MHSFHAKPLRLSDQNALETQMCVDEQSSTVVCNNNLEVTNGLNVGGVVNIVGDANITGAVAITGNVDMAGGLVVQGLAVSASSVQKSAAITAGTAAAGINVVFTQQELTPYKGVHLVAIKLENNSNGYSYLGLAQVGTGNSIYGLTELALNGFTAVTCQNNARTFNVVSAYAGADTNIIVSLYRLNT